VMATPQSPTQIWVRWPGSKTTTSAIPSDAREILVNQTGEVTKVR